MGITFELPGNIEQDLEREVGNLSEAAKEAFLIENYRRGRLSVGDIATILGVETRHEAERWLGQRGVRLNYDLETLEADRKTLDGVLGPVQP